MTGLAATPPAARAFAPDLARGAMLLLIALANVHLYVYTEPVRYRGYPAGLTGADAVVAGLQLALVDGRAYPLFALLFGYGLGQLTARRRAAGEPDRAITGLIRRRGLALMLIGFAHAVLLFPGDIVAAYGLLGLLMAGVVVAGTAVTQLTIAAIGLAVTALVGLTAVLPPLQPVTTLVPSIAVADPLTALADRPFEWLSSGLIGSLLSTFGMVALGMWAARRRFLDEPERHRRQLTVLAAAGLGAAVLGGLPLALIVAGVWSDPGSGVLSLVGLAHAVGGHAGGVGYAALFGLLAARSGTVTHPVGAQEAGPAGRALAACGRRSLSCYLLQSIVFCTLLAAWGLGVQVTFWQAALIGAATWLAGVLASVAMDRAGYRGPAEIWLRTLTYGRGSTRQAS